MWPHTLAASGLWAACMQAWSGQTGQDEEEGGGGRGGSYRRGALAGVKTEDSGQSEDGQTKQTKPWYNNSKYLNLQVSFLEDFFTPSIS